MDLLSGAGGQGVRPLPGPPDDPPAPPEAPLAHRMCPRDLDEFAGQEHLLGEGCLLRRLIAADRLVSAVFWGPPGTGKTALARVIARKTKAAFSAVNAAASSVQELRDLLAQAQARRRLESRRTLLFVDELHRFNRAQQDVLLPDVERGGVILIGATTYNPWFAITSALLSRSQVFAFRALSPADIKTIIRQALKDPARGLGKYPVDLTEEALEHLAAISDGDARRALTALEVAVLSAPPPAPGARLTVDLAAARQSSQRPALRYDRDGDGHYDMASAFIKSLRGSDPDAALYWLARMLESGEEPRFLARRLVICAAEDVGNADPRALVLATSAFQAAELVGLPEARIILAQATTYIACAPKSNAAYLAGEEARRAVLEEAEREVPKHLKATGYRGAEVLGHGADYQYAHDHPGHWVDQEYLPRAQEFYRPTDQGEEARLAKRLAELRQRKKRGAPEGDKGGPGA